MIHHSVYVFLFCLSSDIFFSLWQRLNGNGNCPRNYLVSPFKPLASDTEVIVHSLHLALSYLSWIFPGSAHIQVYANYFSLPRKWTLKIGQLLGVQSTMDISLWWWVGCRVMDAMSWYCEPFTLLMGRAPHHLLQGQLEGIAAPGKTLKKEITILVEEPGLKTITEIYNFCIKVYTFT